MISILFFLKLTSIPIRRWHPLQMFFIRESVITLMTVMNSRPPETATNGIVSSKNHDDVIKWKHFPRYWRCVRGIHRSPVNSLHKGQWRGTLMFFWICAWINSWVNNREAGDLRRHHARYGVTVMSKPCPNPSNDTLNNSNAEYLQNAQGLCSAHIRKLYRDMSSMN